MTGTGQDDVDRALAAVGAKSFVYRSFRRTPRPVEVPIGEPVEEPIEVSATDTEPAPIEASVAPEPEIAASPDPEPAAPPFVSAEEPQPLPLPVTSPAPDEGPAMVRTFQAVAPVFVTAPPAPPPPPPPSAAVAEIATAPSAPPVRAIPELAATSDDADRQSVAQMFKLLTGRADPPRAIEPPRQPEPRRRVEWIPAPMARDTPPPPRPDPPSLGFGLANQLSSRLGAAEPQPSARDIRPERQPAADPRPASAPAATRTTAPSSEPHPVDEGLFRRL